MRVRKIVRACLQELKCNYANNEKLYHWMSEEKFLSRMRGASFQFTHLHIHKFGGKRKNPRKTSPAGAGGPGRHTVTVLRDSAGRGSGQCAHCSWTAVGQCQQQGCRPQRRV